MNLTATVMVSEEVQATEGDIARYRLALPGGETGCVSIGRHAN
jgi:hypothetical protein